MARKNPPDPALPPELLLLDSTGKRRLTIMLTRDEGKAIHEYLTATRRLNGSRSEDLQRAQRVLFHQLDWIERVYGEA